MAQVPVAAGYHYETFRASFPAEYVLHLELNRPKQLNAMNLKFWKECRQIVDQASRDPHVRVVVLSGGSSKHFTAGLDLTEFGGGFGEGTDVGRKALSIRTMLQNMQASFTAFAECRAPVVAAVHGACVGGGVNMIASCDVRWCTKDAVFSIKEVDIGMVGDMGVFQRLPRATGNESLMRELAYTGRNFGSEEGTRLGLISRTFDTKNDMLKEAIEFATEVAAKSPIAVAGIKRISEYSRDHSVADGLGYVALWNSAMLQSEDVPKAIMNSLKKRKPTFEKL